MNKHPERLQGPQWLGSCNWHNGANRRFLFDFMDGYGNAEPSAITARKERSVNTVEPPSARSRAIDVGARTGRWLWAKPGSATQNHSGVIFRP